MRRERVLDLNLWGNILILLQISLNELFVFFWFVFFIRKMELMKVFWFRLQGCQEVKGLGVAIFFLFILILLY